MGPYCFCCRGRDFYLRRSRWKDTIRFLARKGFRVIVPDQIGFGKATKPNIHYSIHLPAAKTRKLIDSLGIKQVVVVGHSMGGMPATRFTVMYPETVVRRVLKDPVGDRSGGRTVVGKARVEKELLSMAGQYPELGRKAVKLIAGATFVEISDVGHIPHLEATESFNRELLTFINR